jgi:ABC-type transport system substrate-binding protein
VGTDFQKGTDWFSEGREAGTGPYMIERVVQGNEVVLTKFDDYWGGWEGQHFDKGCVSDGGRKRFIQETDHRKRRG